jgi:hypothetical protein
MNVEEMFPIVIQDDDVRNLAKLPTPMKGKNPPL